MNQRGIQVKQRRARTGADSGSTGCVSVTHVQTNKTFHGGRRKSKMIYSREKDEIAVFLDFGFVST